MDEINSITLNEFPLKLTYLLDLIYFEGPLASVFLNEYQEFYLYYWSGSDYYKYESDNNLYTVHVEVSKYIQQLEADYPIELIKFNNERNSSQVFIRNINVKNSN